MSDTKAYRLTSSKHRDNNGRPVPKGAVVQLTDRQFAQMRDRFEIASDVPFIETDTPREHVPGAPTQVEAAVNSLKPTPAGQEPVTGPTIERWVAAGYAAENYPPEGRTEVLSAGLTRFRAGGEVFETPEARTIEEDAYLASLEQ